MWSVADAMKLGLILLFIISCTPNTNPNEGGLLGGIYGIGSGTYDERVKEREAELGENRQSPQPVDSSLELEKQRKQRQIAALESELTDVDEQTQLLISQIEGIQADTSEMEAQKAELSQRLQKVMAEIAELRRQSLTKSDDVDSQQQKADELAKEVQQLWEKFEVLKKK